MKHSILAALVLTFLLGIHDGYIALWKQGNPDPVEVFPYQAKYLPPADQKRLETGIPVRSSEQLAQFMEDYLS